MHNARALTVTTETSDCASVGGSRLCVPNSSGVRSVPWTARDQTINTLQLSQPSATIQWTARAFIQHAPLLPAAGAAKRHPRRLALLTTALRLTIRHEAMGEAGSRSATCQQLQPPKMPTVHPPDPSGARCSIAMGTNSSRMGPTAAAHTAGLPTTPAPQHPTACPLQ